ncbi:MAG TPA: hypothetical protein VLJ68_13120 [Chitinophagaceae bacterium]|nr:hypothetical protein [Chitinophagaceae bacterium]
MGNKSAFRAFICVAIIVGFFLPWFKDTDISVSGWAIVKNNSLAFDRTKTATILRYSFLLIPIFSLFVLFRSIGRQSSGLLIRLVPFLVMAVLTALFVFGSTRMTNGEELRTEIFQILSFGFYICAIGSFLLIFLAGD